MPDILYSVLRVIIYSLVGIIFALIVHKFSLVFFNIRLSDEIRAGNKAAGIFAMGLLILIGLIVGLASQ